MQHKIPIDFLGGTSAGALYGIGMAFADFDFDKISSMNMEGVRRKLTSGDFALPMVSLMTGKKFSKYLKDTFKESELEDLWISTFCVSTDLSRAEQVVHRKGKVWQKIFASMAIPVIFPPVILQKHLHVDGGVMDNLPIEPMYHYPVDTIIAISLQNLEVQTTQYDNMPGSWSLLRDKFRKEKKYQLPGIASIISNSILINSKQKQQETREKVSHFIELDLKDVKMLDDSNWKAIIQKGYDQTMNYLKNATIEIS